MLDGKIFHWFLTQKFIRVLLDHRLQRLRQLGNNLRDLRNDFEEIEGLTQRLQRNLAIARDGHDRDNAIQEFDGAIAARREYISRRRDEIEILELEIDNEAIQQQIEAKNLIIQAAIQRRNFLQNQLDNLNQHDNGPWMEKLKKTEFVSLIDDQ